MSSNLKPVSVIMSAAGVQIAGDLGNCPSAAAYRAGMIIFAHGSGSSRLSPRNQHVARLLEEHNFTTLLLDLLTSEEQNSVSKRFDIALLTTRLVEAIHWVREHPILRYYPLGLFGASTGAAAALRAAAVASSCVQAVVSRGGRPDLTGPLISRVKAATLFIVGSEDREVLELNQQALVELSCEKRLTIIPGATHLFEEAGALDDVAHVAAYWFKNHLRVSPEEQPRVM